MVCLEQYKGALEISTIPKVYTTLRRGKDPGAVGKKGTVGGD